MKKLYKKESLGSKEIIKRLLVIIILLLIFVIFFYFRHSRQDTCSKHTGLGCYCSVISIQQNNNLGDRTKQYERQKDFIGGVL